MGTKSNPGKFDCYANAKPDEPIFVLLGRDPCAPLLVELWAQMREKLGEDSLKVAEARAGAGAMRRWLVNLGKVPADIRAAAALRQVMRERMKEETAPDQDCG